MALNLFIGMSQADLEAALKATQKELLTGKSTISANLGEASYSKIMTIGPMERLKMILGALNLLDPILYPIDSVSVPTRTLGTFAGFR